MACDAPAQAYIKCIRCHSGYSPCDKRAKHSDCLNNLVAFAESKTALRNNENFGLVRDKHRYAWRSRRLTASPRVGRDIKREAEILSVTDWYSGAMNYIASSDQYNQTGTSPPKGLTLQTLGECYKNVPITSCRTNKPSWNVPITKK